MATKGTIVGRYVVLREVGRGAMGAVYAAVDPKLDRRVALKVLLDDAQGPAAIARLVREAQSLAKLNHTNVVTVYDVGEFDDHVFIAMEFVEGRTLREWQRAEPRPWRDVLGVYQQAARGLAAAHAEGVIHRDFKPDNAMVDDEGRVRVMDFGLALRGVAPSPTLPGADESQPSTLTQTGSIMGTPAYMSPEQFRQGEVGPHSDQFGFCVALFEALVGERPFQASTLADLASAVTKGEMREPPRGLGVPRWLMQIVRKGLAPSADDRHASMQALLDAVNRGLSTRRRWAAFGGVGALGVLSVAGALQPDVAAGCRDAAHDIREQWNEDRKAEVRDAFMATGHADAVDSWERVERGVGRFVDDWVAQSDHVCGGWRDTLPPELVTVRADCLAIQRAHVAALIEVFSRAESRTVGFAVAATSGLPSPAECANIEDVEGAPPPEWSDAVLAAQRLEARAIAQSHAGDREAAQEGLKQALLALGEHEAPRPRSQILFRQAKREFFAGHVDDAERLLKDAQLLAAKGGDIKLVAGIWLERVVQLNIHRRDELDRQEHLLEAVELAVAQAGNPPEQVARISIVRGMIAADRAEYTSALRHLNEGIELAEGTDTTPSRKAAYIGIVARVQLLQGDSEASQKSSKRAYDTVVEAYGAAHPSASVHMQNIAAACANSEDWTCAREALATVTERLDAAGADATSMRGEHVSMMALVEQRAGNLDRAREYSLDAIAIWEALGTPTSDGAISAKTVLFYILVADDRLDEALKLAEELDTYFRANRAAGHPGSVRGQALLAVAYQAQGRYETALEANERVLAVRDRAKDAGPRMLAGTLFTQGEILRELGRPEDALAAMKRSRDLIADNGGGEPVAEAAFEMAKLSWALGDRDEAIERAREAQRGYLRLGDDTAEERRTVEAWLTERGVSIGLAVAETVDAPGP